MKNYYAILNVSIKASEDDIKKAYKKLALKWHPDINKEENAHEMFLLISEAYQILVDKEKRAEYDKIFLSVDSKSSLGKFGTWQKQARRQAEKYAEMDFDQFTKRVLDEIKLLVTHSPNFGCLAFLFLGLAGTIIMLFIAIVNGDSDLVGSYILVIAVYVGLLFWFYPKFTKSYKENRKEKFNQ